MKSLLFLSLAAFAVSNGNDGSFYQNPGTYFLFSGIGFAIGAVLGFFFARMPNFDYEEVKVSLKTLLPCMLIWGIIIAGIGAMAAYLHIMHCISLQNHSADAFSVLCNLLQSPAISALLQSFAFYRCRSCHSVQKSRFAKQNGIFILYKQNVDKIYFKWYKSYTLCFFEKV